MKDDSLSDTCNAAIMELNKYKYKVGGPYCDMPKSDSVGKQDKSEAMKLMEAEMKAACDNVYAKQIWNDAIEAAAKCVDELVISAEIIRKLKK